MYRAIHWGSGRCENAHDSKRLVSMVDEAHLSRAMGERHGVTDPIVEPARDVGSDHCVEQILKRLSLREGERSACIETVVREVVAVGPDDTKAPMHVTQEIEIVHATSR